MVQRQAVKQRQGTWRRWWQAEIYSQQEARPRPMPWRWQAFQNECLNSYWSFRTTTPSQSCRSGRKRNKGDCKYECCLLRPAHPPKVLGESFINTFICDTLTSNDNDLYEPPSNQGKAYTDTDSDGKTEIITDITCKFKGKLVAMEVKVDPGSETNCHFRCLFPQLCSKDGNLQGECPGTNPGSV